MLSLPLPALYIYTGLWKALQAGTYLHLSRSTRLDSSLAAYLPQDRRQALARGEDLPARAHGAALFADIAGFTPLTEALDRALGARRGVEEMTRQINCVYDALIGEVEHYR